MGFWILLIIVLVIWYGVKASKKKEIERRRQVEADDGYNINISFSTNYGNDDDDDYYYSDEPEIPRNATPAKWIPANAMINISGYNIPGGLIYVGEALKADNYHRTQDVCLINPNLEVKPSEPWDFNNDDIGYWPSYYKLKPQQRGAYLKWLATGRSEPEAYIGFVFIFFYGLERRLIVDGKKGLVSEEERNQIINEIVRLIKIYENNHSFTHYAKNLLALEWIIYQNEDVVPDYLSDNEDAVKYLVAKKVGAGQTIDKKLALDWVLADPEIRLRTPARRCEEEFEKLFQIRYEEAHGDGIKIKPNKTKFKVEYRPASSSIRYDTKWDVPELPNAFMLSGPRNKLNNIAEKCTDELDAYSRYLGRKDNDPNSISAKALLPKELLSESSELNELKNKLNDLLEKQNSFILVVDLFSLLGEPLPIKINKKEAESLGTFVESLGFGFSPDVRYHGIKPTIDGLVKIFAKGHGVDFKPSREYYTMGTILKLGAMVSQIDNDLSPAEEKLLSDLITNDRELNGIEKDSLQAYLYWALRTPQSTAGLKQRIQNICPEEKEAISEILLAVAHADGKIDPSEIKQLEKLYAALGLDKTDVVKDLYSIATEQWPVTVAVKDKPVSYSIPDKKSEKSKGFELNEQLIKIREAETKQVKGVLEEIFTEQTEEDVSKTFEPVVEETSAISQLDKTHQELFNKIHKQESWEREVFQGICKELGLMVDGAMEILNEWAFEVSNAPLIEDGEPIYVDINLAEEIING